jgi:cardiolipin synthase (CMP-forming)
VGSSRRRLFGIDRSGPLPRATRRGAPLHPLTIPNLVGYLRLAAIPVFLYLAWESDDGRYAPATLVYVAITTGDYLDGFLARATGQYSRMGALLDPVVDRAAVLAGAAVCWHFELLPRWALAVLAVREVVTLVLAQLALHRGIDIEVNWIGRIGVFAVFGSIGLSLMLESWAIEALFILGVAISVGATWVYVRAGLGRGG